MLDLSPTKLLIIFVVVVVLLGPKRLPQVARQLGEGWRKLREMHFQVDQELRKSIPNLPSSQEIVHYARSPMSLLNRLAETPAAPDTVEDEGFVADEAFSADEGFVADEGFSTGGGSRPERRGPKRPPRPRPASLQGEVFPGARVADDPHLN